MNIGKEKEIIVKYGRKKVNRRPHMIIGRLNLVLIEEAHNYITNKTTAHLATCTLPFADAKCQTSPSLLYD